MKKIKFILLTIALLTILFAQTDYETWKKQRTKDYSTYREKQDTEFAEFLEANWENFESYHSDKPDDVPKPVEIPKAEQKELKPISKSKKIKKIEVQVDEQKQKDNVFFAVDKSASVIEINYFGMMLDYNFQSNFEMKLEEIDEKAIANFWLKASDTGYKKLLEQLAIQKEKMDLNDWGYCVLVNKISEEVCKDDKNLQKLFVWFLLTKTGFNSKVGFSENEIFLLLPTSNVIYGVSYIIIDEIRYYAISFDKTEKLNISINTFAQNYPDADALIDLTVDSAPNIGSSILEKELKFEYDGVAFTIPVRYDASAIEFFKSYPQTELDVYFNAPLSQMAVNSLTQGFQLILEDKTEAEAANIILRFVQTAFQYKTDGDQFGREKTFFADELLFYPYCDCEDRSILYSFLVGKLLELDVIGLDYPGHISTAVKFNSKISGDFVMFGSEQYTICDPTYINANLGMTIPEFKEIEPKIIELAKK